jgi:sec-independent protein translocase protein TatB
VFGLSWDRIILILVVLVFVVGPERIPTAVNWVMSSLRRLRIMAAGAQAELRSQIGPELDELRRQVAELQSLKEIQELRTLRDLNPRTIIGKNILGDEFSGGITGFLGLNSPAEGTAAAATVADSAPQADGAPASAAGADFAANGAANGAVTAIPTTNDAADGTANGSTNGYAAVHVPSQARVLATGESPPIDFDAT